MRKHLQHFLITAADSVRSVRRCRAIGSYGKIVDGDRAPLIRRLCYCTRHIAGCQHRRRCNFTLNEIEDQPTWATSRPKNPSWGRTQHVGIIQMPDAVALQDVIVMQSVAVQRKTPVAVSDGSRREERAQTRRTEFPEIRNRRRRHVTKDAGGFGDSKITRAVSRRPTWP